jgi:hypothetical protein
MNHNVIISDAKLRSLALHRVGNKGRQEGIYPSKKLLQLNDEDFVQRLQHFFLKHFKNETFYQFGHNSDLNLNEVYNFCTRIFESKEEQLSFYEQSVNILKSLYECSDHNKINDGELYVAYFEDMVLDDELVDAIGIFKIETKNQFIKLRLDEEEDWTLYFDEGTSLESLDKGCMIFNTLADDGYRITSVDMKGSDARYWRDDFLQLVQIHDDNFYTKTYLNLCKEYGKTQFEKEEKQEQVNFLNKSLEYFSSNDAFSFDELVTELFEEDEDKKEQFKSYKKNFQEKEGLLPEEETFFIAAPVVKKAERSFRKIIQLDTEVEIKIQSSKAQEEGLLERGFDESKGMYYYKIFFHDEF